MKSQTKPKDDVELFDPPPAAPPPNARAAKQQRAMTVATAQPPKVVAPDAGALAFLATVERLSTNKDTNPAIVEMLLKEMRELRAEQARSMFDIKMAEMQSRLPVAPRKGKIEVRAKDSKGERTGNVLQSTPYAKWEDVVEMVTPVLGEHGFSLQFKTGLTEKGLVRVIGILAGHGHRETSEIELQHDSTGSKNAVQAVASSISYGKRHVAGALLNLVSRGEDDDGHGAGAPVTVGEPVDPDQTQNLIDLCSAIGVTKEQFLGRMNKTRPNGHPEMTEFGQLPASRYQEAVEGLRAHEARVKQQKKGAQA